VLEGIALQEISQFASGPGTKLGIYASFCPSTHPGFRRLDQIVHDLRVTALRALILVPTVFKGPVVNERTRHLRLRQLWSVAT
jgi:hypothetical protein